MFRDSESELCVDCGGVLVEGYARPLRTQLIVASADPQGLQTKGRSGISHLFNYLGFRLDAKAKRQLAARESPGLLWTWSRGPRRTTATAPLQLQLWGAASCLFACSLAR
jgi:hypothetical protein